MELRENCKPSSGASAGEASEGRDLQELSALGGTRTPNLLIRSQMIGRPMRPRRPPGPTISAFRGSYRPVRPVEAVASTPETRGDLQATVDFPTAPQAIVSSRRSASRIVGDCCTVRSEEHTSE